MMRLVVCLLLVATSVHARPYQRKYKYYLNAERAEETLSSIALNRRLYDDEWLNILGSNRKTETYKVRRGDSLWKISRSYVTDPKFWRKFWQMNPFLTNPHEIEVGTILTLYQERGDAPAIRIPIIRLVAGGATDLDADSLVLRNTKNQFRPRIMVITEDDIVGEIEGAYTEKEALNLDDDFFVSFNEAETRPGVRYSIIREERRLEDGAQNLGMVVRLLGELVTIGKGEELLKAELRAMYGVIRRGDKLIALQMPVKTSAVFNPPPDLETRIVMGEDADKKAFAQSDLLLLNKGTEDGMKVGYQFRVYQDMDPLTEKKNTVEPDHKGEVQIIASSAIASVGLVIRNKEPLFIGDTLVPYQNFPNPPPKPTKERQTIELD